jgi:hypothetical protein
VGHVNLKWLHWLPHHFPVISTAISYSSQYSFFLYRNRIKLSKYLKATSFVLSLSHCNLEYELIRQFVVELETNEYKKNRRAL